MYVNIVFVCVAHLLKKKIFWNLRSVLHKIGSALYMQLAILQYSFQQHSVSVIVVSRSEVSEERVRLTGSISWWNKRERTEVSCLYRYARTPKAKSHVGSRIISFSRAYTCIYIKGKGKGHPRTGREGPEWEQMYSSTLPSTSALDGGWWSAPRPGRFTPRKDPVPIV